MESYKYLMYELNYEDNYRFMNFKFEKNLVLELGIYSLCVIINFCLL